MNKSQKRKRCMSIRSACTPEEYDAITEKAMVAGISTGGYIRSCCLEKVTSGTKRRAQVDSAILERAISEMRRIGNNLNQLARTANMNQSIDSTRLRQALTEHTATLQLLREARNS